MSPTARLGIAALVTLALVWFCAAAVLASTRGERFFTLDQERVVARAMGPGCIWRDTHGLPAGLAFACLAHERTTPGLRWSLTAGDTVHRIPAIGEQLPDFRLLVMTGDRLWITGMALVAVAWRGLPIIRTAGACSGPIVRAHQWAARHRGTTSIFNLELACERHNGSQSSTWSWWWAARQWPWTLPVYGYRVTLGTIRLAWLILTDERARRAAR